MKDIFVLFPIDLFKDIYYLNNSKVILVEHERFFDRSSKQNGSMKLNILKPVYHRASMQEYFQFLKTKKIDVEYISLKQNWIKIVKKHLSKNKDINLKLFDPVDRILEKEINNNFKNYEIINTPRFILGTDDLKEYSDTHKSLRQTSFYSWMRKKTNVLMDRNLKPEGGKLTYDVANRNPPYKGMADDINKKSSKIGEKAEQDISTDNKVISAVKYVTENIAESHLQIWNGSYKDIKKNKYNLSSVGLELRFPIDHKGADSRLKYFIKNKLDNFGTYQDAIIGSTEDNDLRSFIYHSGISVMLNVGLLTPWQVIDAILKYYKSKSNKKKILPDVEGFVRQLIGWREFSRYTYEYESIKYLNKNFFSANKKLNKSWYGATTNILPVDDCIEKAFKFGYLHHIERLMVISNFMTISSIHPKEMFRWFTEFSLDSYDWVMEYNIYVMASYSDGGNFTTKPYISSSNYIFKMSDYQNNSLNKEWANKWDLLFWKFMKRHKTKIKKINRLSMLLKYADSNIKKLTK
jgi:deoxyribodipyrimidine photolyase-related protein